jgi:hypothetical protein
MSLQRAPLALGQQRWWGKRIETRVSTGYADDYPQFRETPQDRILPLDLHIGRYPGRSARTTTLGTEGESGSNVWRRRGRVRHWAPPGHGTWTIDRVGRARSDSRAGAGLVSSQRKGVSRANHHTNN